MIELDIIGDPKPQARGRNCGRRVYLPRNPWRETVRAAVQVALLRKVKPIEGAVWIYIVWRLPRSAELRKRDASCLRRGVEYPQDPPCITNADTDNFEKATLDEISTFKRNGRTRQGLFGNDNRVIPVCKIHRYARPGEKPGCYVRIEPYHGERVPWDKE